jgi:hypothetical protein
MLPIVLCEAISPCGNAGMAAELPQHTETCEVAPTRQPGFSLRSSPTASSKQVWWPFWALA